MIGLDYEMTFAERIEGPLRPATGSRCPRQGQSITVVVARARQASDAAVDLARTGDVWLFGGRTIADRAIQVATNSPVNHVGMSWSSRTCRR